MEINWTLYFLINVMGETKYIILVHAGKLSTEEIGEKFKGIYGQISLPVNNEICGMRDELSWDLDFSFLDVDEGKMRVIITDSDNLVRQINLAILRGSLERTGKEIPESCKKIKGIDYEEVKAYWLGLDGKVESLEVTENGINVPVLEAWIEEMNKMMEDLYYGLKYS